MIIKRNALLNEPHFKYHGKYDLDLTLLKKNIQGFIDLPTLIVDISLNKIDELVIGTIKVKGKMILESSRTLKPLDFSFNEKEDFTFTFEEPEEDMDLIYLSNDQIDLDTYVSFLLEVAVPYKIVGKDEAEHIEGENWELISEDEYLRRKNESSDGDPRFDKLKNLFDEEE